MYVESACIVEALLDLANRKVPITAYPVHDCLICKESDEPRVVSALQKSVQLKVGSVPVLDVEYVNRKSKIINVDGDISINIDDHLSNLINTCIDDGMVIEDL